MSRRLRLRIALGLLAFVGNATLRPAIAAATAEAIDAEQPGAPAPSSGPTVTPYPGGAAPAPPYAEPPYGQRPPPGYAPYPAPYAPYAPAYPPLQLVQVHKVRRGLVTGGAITFGVSWGIAASIAFVLSTSNCSGSGCNNNADYLWIPIAGPLVVAASDSGSDGSGIFILWSAAQAAGLAMFIIGMMGHDVMEYRVAQRGPTLHLTPLLAREAGGMALTARW
jgi:hypothetical protein